MTGVGDDSRGRLLGRPWFVVGLALALAATLALVLADDIRYLRLGIVAALWAALVGAFLAVRYRKQVAGTEEAVAQAQEVYELELEREIAARREYELEVENDVRARVQADSRQELDSLRAEVAALRDNLQSLFGGEVLLERFALTAQATRMRALREEQKIVEATGNGHTPAQLTAASAEDAVRSTGNVDRVREKPSARPGRRPGAPEPRRPERSLDLPPRRAAKSEPMRSQPQRGGVAASVAKAAADARAEQTRVQRPPVTPDGTGPNGGPNGFPPDLTRPAFDSVERRRQPAERQATSAAEERTKFAKPVDADVTASWREPLTSEESGASGNTAPDTPEPPVVSERSAERSRPRMSPSERRAERSLPRIQPVQPGAEQSRPRIQPVKPRFEGSRPRMRPVQRSQPPAQPSAEASRPRIQPVQPSFPPAEISRPRMQPVQRPPAPSSSPQPPQPQRGAEVSRPRMAPVPPPQQESRFELSRPMMEPAAERPPSRPEEIPMSSNPTLPEEVRRLAQEGRPGGRRRRPDDEAPAAAPAEQTAGSGRRRRPDGEPPSWEAPARGQSTASHARPEPDAGGGHRVPEGGGRRAAPEEPASGSHSAGRSVSDLLAAQGMTTDAIPRRRRRAED